MRAHVIQNGVVTNTIEISALDALPGVTLIDASLYGGTIGDIWDGQSLHAPPAPPVDRAAACRRIDDGVAAIYARYLRFEVEYTEREAQANAYKAASYTGTVPARVAEFATPAGLAAKAATDLILSQAAALRGALNQLSALRMRKYEVLRAASNADAGAAAAEILAAIAAIGAQVS